jgi:flagellum-specific peptidoglycan hydrolase FlgJ
MAHRHHHNHHHRRHVIHAASNAQFISEASKAAIQSEIATGVPASITVAQAILESGWGKHHIGTANNYFGIKAQTRESAVTYGQVATGFVNVNTREHIKGKDQVLKQPFRSYQSMTDSFIDHGLFLAGNHRYRKHLDEYTKTGDSLAFAQGLQEAGYATDPHYAELLIGIVKKYKLDQLNVKKQAGATTLP